MDRKISMTTAQRALVNAIEDLNILAGNEVGPSDVSWQDIAGTAAVNLRCVAKYLDQTIQLESGTAFMLDCHYIEQEEEY